MVLATMTRAMTMATATFTTISTGIHTAVKRWMLISEASPLEPSPLSREPGVILPRVATATRMATQAMILAAPIAKAARLFCATWIY